MPVRVQTLDGGAGLFFQPFGVLSIDEVLRSMDYPEATLREARYVLVDLNEIQEMQVRGEDVSRIAVKDLHNTEVNPRLVQAILATDDLAFGTARIYAARFERGGWRTSIFRSRVDAEGWLSNILDFQPAFKPDSPLRDSWE
jgi:hypothetical protein